MILRSESATSQLQKERIVKGRAEFTLRLFMDEGNFALICAIQQRAGRVRLK